MKFKFLYNDLNLVVKLQLLRLTRKCLYAFFFFVVKYVNIFNIEGINELIKL